MACCCLVVRLSCLFVPMRSHVLVQIRNSTAAHAEATLVAAGGYAPAPTERPHIIHTWIQHLLMERIQDGGIKVASALQARMHSVLSSAMLAYEQCKCVLIMSVLTLLQRNILHSVKAPGRNQEMRSVVWCMHCSEMGVPHKSCVQMSSSHCFYPLVQYLSHNLCWPDVAVE